MSNKEYSTEVKTYPTYWLKTMIFTSVFMKEYHINCHCYIKKIYNHIENGINYKILGLL